MSTWKFLGECQCSIQASWAPERKHESDHSGGPSSAGFKLASLPCQAGMGSTPSSSLLKKAGTLFAALSLTVLLGQAKAESD